MFWLTVSEIAYVWPYFFEPVKGRCIKKRQKGSNIPFWRMPLNDLISFH